MSCQSVLSKWLFINPSQNVLIYIEKIFFIFFIYISIIKLMKIKEISNKFLQIIYITCRNFFSNNLITYSQACSFTFFISLVPIFLMIMVISIRILHTSPEFLEQIFKFADLFIDKDRITSILDSIVNVKKIGIFEIIIGFFVLWMSKGFFFATIKGIRKIFHNHTKQKKILVNLIGIIMEAILVIGIAIIVGLIFTMRRLLQNSLLDSVLPNFLIDIFDFIFKFLPEILLFIIICLVYRFASGTKPKFSLCIISSLLCTISFTITTKIFTLFLNITKYNIIYGVLSSIIVVLIEVNFFFYIFFFCCELLHTLQFFCEKV